MGGGGSSHVSTSANAVTSSGNNGSNPTMRVPNTSSRSRMGMKRRRTDPNFRVIRNGGETRVTEDGEVEGDEEGQGSRLETTRSAAV